MQRIFLIYHRPPSFITSLATIFRSTWKWPLCFSLENSITGLGTEGRMCEGSFSPTEYKIQQPMSGREPVCTKLMLSIYEYKHKYKPYIHFLHSNRHTYTRKVTRTWTLRTTWVRKLPQPHVTCSHFFSAPFNMKYTFHYIDSYKQLGICTENVVYDNMSHKQHLICSSLHDFM